MMPFDHRVAATSRTNTRAGRNRAATARQGRGRRLLAAVAAAVAGTVVFAVLTNGGQRARTVESLLPSIDAAAQWAGLGIDQVSVSGHRFTPDGDVFDALDLPHQRSLLGFDSAAAKARIEKLAWVARAELTRDYPGRLDVRIAERKAFAVWRTGEREMLIDNSGRVLQPVPTGSVTNLPRVEGETAEREAPSLLVLVARTPELAQRFARGVRVGGRRWALYLHGGTRIELPSEGETLVLDELAASGALEKLLAGPASVIDLRARGRIAVRPVPRSELPVERVSQAAPPHMLRDGPGAQQ